MSDIAERLTEAERERSHHANLRPRDAATLIVIDRSGPAPRVLMGRRHAAHAFMPGKYVFPGGRVEPYDGRMPALGALAPEHEARLLKRVSRASPARARAIALAAIRETCEEVGLLLGRRTDEAPKAPSPAWRPFADAQVVPDLSQLHFIARAITPPRRNRRFDARFFAADAEAIGHRIDGVVGPHSELDEIVWISITDAKRLDLPTITHVVLEELERRIAEGFDPALPAPFFRMLHGRFVRELL
ncbi:MAG: NUDIX domain-containing protein [Variibacter sp.]|nr:NUDIX domain-containing protein [Variibacter sp.]